MPTFNCANQTCRKEFYSKHSTARYCGRRCAGIATMGKADVKARHRERMRKYTDEELIAMLIQQAEHLGRTPRSRELACPSSTTYEDRFGSYTNAVLLAGLVPNRALPRQHLENGRRSISLSLRFRILERDGFRCQYCGGTPQDGYVLQVDHIVAVADGGATVPENLLAACWPCNSGKGSTALSHAPVAQWQRAALMTG